MILSRQIGRRLAISTADSSTSITPIDARNGNDRRRRRRNRRRRRRREPAAATTTKCNDVVVSSTLDIEAFDERYAVVRRLPPFPSSSRTAKATRRTKRTAMRLVPLANCRRRRWCRRRCVAFPPCDFSCVPTF